MNTLILTALLLQSPAVSSEPRIPVNAMNPQVSDHLLKEIAKGKDQDDPGKVILLWIKADAGALGDQDRATLIVLANRKATRSILADKDLYLTLFAAKILQLDEKRQAEAKALELERQREAERNNADDKFHRDLLEQIEQLKKEIEQLKKNHAGSS
ncbi:MAG: hypothetical protein KW788_01765 [Candidatus Doudnabacteria bacterium]|nr:hypothetical protein [Candidatus Doudnabacteria bacterium]